MSITTIVVFCIVAIVLAGFLASRHDQAILRSRVAPRLADGPLESGEPAGPKSNEVVQC
jgi:hypothetical protein